MGHKSKMTIEFNEAMPLQAVAQFMHALYVHAPNLNTGSQSRREKSSKPEVAPKTKKQSKQAKDAVQQDMPRK